MNSLVGAFAARLFEVLGETVLDVVGGPVYAITRLRRTGTGEIAISTVDDFVRRYPAEIF